MTVPPFSLALPPHLSHANGRSIPCSFFSCSKSWSSPNCACSEYTDVPLDLLAPSLCAVSALCCPVQQIKSAQSEIANKPAKGRIFSCLRRGCILQPLGSESRRGRAGNTEIHHTSCVLLSY